MLLCSYTQPSTCVAAPASHGKGVKLPPKPNPGLGRLFPRGAPISPPPRPPRPGTAGASMSRPGGARIPPPGLGHTTPAPGKGQTPRPGTAGVSRPDPAGAPLPGRTNAPPPGTGHTTPPPVLRKPGTVHKTDPDNRKAGTRNPPDAVCIEAMNPLSSQHSQVPRRFAGQPRQKRRFTPTSSHAQLLHSPHVLV